MGSLKLVGVGVGPGDPELITLKALNVLRGCDVILVPATEASGSGSGRAEQIVLSACPEVADHIDRIPFSMADRSGLTEKRLASWQVAAEAAVRHYRDGAKNIAFATIGDPSVYSTFSYLVAGVRDQIESLDVEVVPGITAMQALAAKSATPLVEGDEILALVPLKRGINRLVEVHEVTDTCVVYKAGRHMKELQEHLAALGEDAIAGVNVGLENETVTKVSQLAEAPYFTSVLWPPKRGRAGERI